MMMICICIRMIEDVWCGERLGGHGSWASVGSCGVGRGTLSRGYWAWGSMRSDAGMSEWRRMVKGRTLACC